jgi:hypothetical protein
LNKNEAKFLSYPDEAFCLKIPSLRRCMMPLAFAEGIVSRKDKAGKTYHTVPKQKVSGYQLNGAGK